MELISVQNSLLKGEFTFFYSRIGCPLLGESNLMCLKKSVEVKFFMVAFFGVRPTLLITLGAHFYDQTSYHCSSGSSYLAYSPSTVAALRYSSSLSVQQRSVTQNMKVGKNVQMWVIALGAPNFQVLCDGLLLDGKTTAIPQGRYYTWKICKI